MLVGGGPQGLDLGNIMKAELRKFARRQHMGWEGKGGTKGDSEGFIYLASYLPTKPRVLNHQTSPVLRLCHSFLLPKFSPALHAGRIRKSKVFSPSLSYKGENLTKFLLSPKPDF